MDLDKKALEKEEADIDAVFAAVGEFSQRMVVLDKKATQIKSLNSYDSNPQTFSELTTLQAEKEAIAKDVVAKMKRRLSKTSVEKFNKRINELIKKKIKILSPYKNMPEN